MEREEVVKILESLLNDLENAYYGGFRTTTKEQEHEAIREAIRLLK